MAGFAARAGAAMAKGQAAHARAAKVRVKTTANADQKPVITAMTVVVGTGLLRAWLVDKKAMPDRSYWVKMAVLGFILALISELEPRLGKGMAYLVLTATVFAQTPEILQELQIVEVAPAGPPGAPTPLRRRAAFPVPTKSRGRKDPHKQDWPRPHANNLPPARW